MCSRCLRRSEQRACLPQPGHLVQQAGRLRACDRRLHKGLSTGVSRARRCGCSDTLTSSSVRPGGAEPSTSPAPAPPPPAAACEPVQQILVRLACAKTRPSSGTASSHSRRSQEGSTADGISLSEPMRFVKLRVFYAFFSFSFPDPDSLRGACFCCPIPLNNRGLVSHPNKHVVKSARVECTEVRTVSSSSFSQVSTLT